MNPDDWNQYKIFRGNDRRLPSKTMTRHEATINEIQWEHLNPKSDTDIDEDDPLIDDLLEILHQKCLTRMNDEPDEPDEP